MWDNSETQFSASRVSGWLNWHSRLTPILQLVAFRLDLAMDRAWKRPFAELGVSRNTVRKYLRSKEKPRAKAAARLR
jgi:hypothetical protein